MSRCFKRGSVIRETEFEKFCRSVDLSASPFDCWEWSNGEVGTQEMRNAWERSFGKIPKGMHVLRRCGNVRCINSNHFFLRACES